MGGKRRRRHFRGVVAGAYLAAGAFDQHADNTCLRQHDLSGVQHRICGVEHLILRPLVYLLRGAGGLLEMGSGLSEGVLRILMVSGIHYIAPVALLSATCKPRMMLSYKAP